ncbi:Hypothetical predicted protein [Drosophila guanche]|uniref:Uncharacterized protein n=1 Tax=Drosophila guanche TaxID=7266 RepID=A0A3B0KDS9_DROGU|nr:Hypothetical predicted protein [Drosophila guanche]
MKYSSHSTAQHSTAQHKGKSSKRKTRTRKIYSQINKNYLLRQKTANKRYERNAAELLLPLPLPLTSLPKSRAEQSKAELFLNVSRFAILCADLRACGVVRSSWS